jgi:hypothetical protein
MLLSVLVILIIAAFITVILAAMGKCPLWVAVLLVVVAMMVQAIPVAGK